MKTNFTTLSFEWAPNEAVARAIANEGFRREVAR